MRNLCVSAEENLNIGHAFGSGLSKIARIFR